MKVNVRNLAGVHLEIGDRRVQSKLGVRFWEVIQVDIMKPNPNRHSEVEMGMSHEAVLH